MSIREHDDPEFFKTIQEQNLLRQYDLLNNCIEIGLRKGIEAFDKYTLWSLNHAAVANITQFGGRYRKQPIYVGDHIPPHFNDVPGEMDRFISVVHENWDIPVFRENPAMMPAYALWRMNWIHPFIEGNGRTARAACYYLLCMRAGRLLGGSSIVPELIQADRKPYYEALSEADTYWVAGHFNVDQLTLYIQEKLIKQLRSEDAESVT